MARAQIDYGIDLGTTNSAICRMEGGVPTIKKTDTQKDTMPSCVAFTRKKGVRAGDSAFNDLKTDRKRRASGDAQEANAFIEFKRTMGTDTQYPSSHMGRAFSSEELSAEVLKALKSFIQDEVVTAAVVTVPAKFTANQKNATLEAARMAGLAKCELLQEPIAAAMAYGISSQEKAGRWVVFDFGGGTFDAALLKVEDGIMQVSDTAGDNYLGGKNLDEAVVEHFILPYLRREYSLEGTFADKTRLNALRELVKGYAEEFKNQLSFRDSYDLISNLGELGEDEDGEDMELDLTLTQSQLFEVLRPLFQKAVDITRELVQRNGLKGSDISSLILVGGPTHSPLIRSMLQEQITPNVKTDADPMTVVAEGAALYASSIKNEGAAAQVEVGTVKFDLDYEATSVDSSVWMSVKLADGAATPVMLELLRGDGAWGSDRVRIDAKGDVVELSLVEGRANGFRLRCFDGQGNQLPCFPEEISIIQGSKIGAAPLPYNIAIARWDAEKEQQVIAFVQGLEKNKPLPAVGTRNGLKTTAQLRPGVGSDIVKVPIYQAEENSEGHLASLYEYVADVIVTGEEVGRLVPAGSSVDLTLKVDSSEMMELEMYFIETDETVTKQLDTSKKQSVQEASMLVQQLLRDADRELLRLERAGVDTARVREELERARAEVGRSSEPKAALQHVKEVMRSVQHLDSSSSWDQVEGELKTAFDRLEQAVQKKGGAEIAANHRELKAKAEQAMHRKDVQLAKELIEMAIQMEFNLTRREKFLGLLFYMDQDFNTIPWSDAGRARQLINRAMQMATSGESEEQLMACIAEAYRLIPQGSGPDASGLLS
ncbi:MAG: heat-shock protein Hsp70 [Bacteroidia bacterium]|nr:MAG: heat-shock protein Hsp70 [Bacteroidia bacterium]